MEKEERIHANQWSFEGGAMRCPEWPFFHYTLIVDNPKGRLCARDDERENPLGCPL